jgi:hypothetical protein
MILPQIRCKTPFQDQSIFHLLYWILHYTLFHGLDTLGSHLREEGSIDYDGGLVRLQVQTKFDRHIDRQQVQSLNKNHNNTKTTSEKGTELEKKYYNLRRPGVPIPTKPAQPHLYASSRISGARATYWSAILSWTRWFLSFIMTKLPREPESQTLGAETCEPVSGT